MQEFSISYFFFFRRAHRDCESGGAFGKLLQVQDVSDFGSLKEAASLLLPGSSRIISMRSFQSSAATRNPRTYYLYEFEKKGKRVAMSAAVSNGNIYVLGAAAPGSRWREAATRLRAVARSFLLLG
eukprot:TRINITY_DN369_c0_g1_i6.p1 TRINITY_DN369_c0_g1~~TRINITY_DN369_c0_g1_i6.p1  ORF type:complete len:126 (+),score=25.12 TRINITY_DN369_c0_g1_i6:111-488(+)